MDEKETTDTITEVEKEGRNDDPAQKEKTELTDLLLTKESQKKRVSVKLLRQGARELAEYQRRYGKSF